MMIIIIVARCQGAGPSLMALSATLIAVLAGKVFYALASVELDIVCQSEKLWVKNFL